MVFLAKKSDEKIDKLRDFMRETRVDAIIQEVRAEKLIRRGRFKDARARVLGADDLREQARDASKKIERLTGKKIVRQPRKSLKEWRRELVEATLIINTGIQRAKRRGRTDDLKVGRKIFDRFITRYGKDLEQAFPRKPKKTKAKKFRLPSFKPIFKKLRIPSLKSILRLKYKK